MLEPAATESDHYTEPQRVVFRRFREAREAGLTLVEARLFAESDADIGVLRKLVRDGCPPKTMARILV
jgi:hypothetical protein